MSYPPFGLTEQEAETLIRLAAATADESQGGTDEPYSVALMSFSDHDAVHVLGVRTWRTIESRE